MSSLERPPAIADIPPMGEALVYWLGGVAAGVWVWRTRRRYTPIARPLSDVEIQTFAGCFSRELLASVRIATVAQIALPGARWARRAVADAPGPPGHDAGPGGIALGNLVVLASPHGSPLHVGVLFHELVHVAQYRHLAGLWSVRGFLSLYLRQWVEGGRSYAAIGLEQQAYDLQTRFECGETMDVQAHIAQTWPD